MGRRSPSLGASIRSSIRPFWKLLRLINTFSYYLDMNPKKLIGHYGRKYSVKGAGKLSKNLFKNLK